MINYKFTIILILLIIMISQLSAQYHVGKCVFGNGAGRISNTNYSINGTVGQSLAGKCDNSSSIKKIGFWYSIDWIVSDITNNYTPMIPENFGLMQNFPNPFNPVTTISYALPKSVHVRVDVYNILGQHIITLVDNLKPAGYHKIKFSGLTLPSGYYIYRIQTDGFSEVKKMMLLK